MFAVFSCSYLTRVEFSKEGDGEVSEGERMRMTQICTQNP